MPTPPEAAHAPELSPLEIEIPLPPSTSGNTSRPEITSGLSGLTPSLLVGRSLLGSVSAIGTFIRDAEANLYNLTSYLIVENLRRGMSPKDAGMEGLKRIVANTVERRLLNGRGTPNFGIQFYVLNARGEHAGVTMYPGGTYAVCDEDGPHNVPLEPLLQGAAGG